MKRFYSSFGLWYCTAVFGICFFSCTSGTPDLSSAAAISDTASDSAPAAVVYLSSDDTVPEGTEFQEGDEIKTDDGMMLKLSDGSDIELDKNTSVKLSSVRRTGARNETVLKLSRGAIRSRVDALPSRARYSVVTPISVAGVRGTDFSVTYDPVPSNATASGVDNSDVDVFEGTVEVEQGDNSVSVGKDEGATVSGRMIRRRAIIEKIRERWDNRRHEIVERLRSRLGAGPDDDIRELLKERFKNMSPQQREAIKNRLNEIQEKVRQRAKTAVERAREHREAERNQREKRVRNNHPNLRRNR